MLLLELELFTDELLLTEELVDLFEFEELLLVVLYDLLFDDFVLVFPEDLLFVLDLVVFEEFLLELVLLYCLLLLLLPVEYFVLL